MLAVPAAVESIWKPEGPYLSIRRANDSHPKKVAQATGIMAADQIRSDRVKWSEIETSEAGDVAYWDKCEVPTGSELVCFPG